MVTDRFGVSVTTDTVVMSRLSITAQPQDAVVSGNNKTCTFTVGAAGEGLTYKWYYRNAGAENFSVSAVTTNSYAVAMTAARNGRQIYCVITDQFGNSVQTRTATMSIR